MNTKLFAVLGMALLAVSACSQDDNQKETQKVLPAEQKSTPDADTDRLQSECDPQTFSSPNICKVEGDGQAKLFRDVCVKNDSGYFVIQSEFVKSCTACGPDNECQIKEKDIGQYCSVDNFEAKCDQNRALNCIHIDDTYYNVVAQDCQSGCQITENNGHKFAACTEDNVCNRDEEAYYYCYYYTVEDVLAIYTVSAVCEDNVTVYDGLDSDINIHDVYTERGESALAWAESECTKAQVFFYK